MSWKSCSKTCYNHENISHSRAVKQDLHRHVNIALARTVLQAWEHSRKQITDMSPVYTEETLYRVNNKQHKTTLLGRNTVI